MQIETLEFHSTLSNGMTDWDRFNPDTRVNLKLCVQSLSAFQGVAHIQNGQTSF